MAKLTAREELVTLAAAVCVALILVALVAGITLANTVHQIHPDTTGQISGLAGSSGAPASATR